MQAMIWMGLGSIFAGMLALKKRERNPTETTPPAPPVHFPRTSVFLMLFGLGMSIMGWMYSTPVPASAAPTLYFYETLGPGWNGQFRKEGKVWKEYNKDNMAGRAWAEAPASSNDRLRLVDQGAIIEIEAITNTIYYTDPGRQDYPTPKPLYRIVVP